jgi:hypothetical protein
MNTTEDSNQYNLEQVITLMESAGVPGKEIGFLLSPRFRPKGNLSKYFLNTDFFQTEQAWAASLGWIEEKKPEIFNSIMKLLFEDLPHERLQAYVKEMSSENTSSPYTILSEFLSDLREQHDGDAGFRYDYRGLCKERLKVLISNTNSFDIDSPHIEYQQESKTVRRAISTLGLTAHVLGMDEMYSQYMGIVRELQGLDTKETRLYLHVKKYRDEMIEKYQERIKELERKEMPWYKKVFALKP